MEVRLETKIVVMMKQWDGENAERSPEPFRMILVVNIHKPDAK